MPQRPFGAIVWHITVAAVVAASTSASASPPSAELAVIFAKWKAAVSEPERYEIRGQRIIYNHVFEEETLANIVIQFEAPDSFRFEVQPLEVNGGGSNRKNRKTGKHYQLKSSEPWLLLRKGRDLVICSPGEGRLISSQSLPEGVLPQKASLEVPPPPALPEDPLPLWQEWIVNAGQFYLNSWNKAWYSEDGVNWSPRWWPLFSPELLCPTIFLVNSSMLPKEAEWIVVKRSEETIQLKCKIPPKFRQQFTELEVILDIKSGLPKAQRMSDPGGNLDTILIFNEWDLKPDALSFTFDERRWDFEIIPLPSDLPLMRR